MKYHWLNLNFFDLRHELIHIKKIVFFKTKRTVLTLTRENRVYCNLKKSVSKVIP